MTVDVVIPTLRKSHAFRAIESLRHLPFLIRLDLVTEGHSWPSAVNLGLSRSSGDILLMDDDVVLAPETFKDFMRRYDEADIFGFKLLMPNGRIQHAGGVFENGTIGHRFYNEDASRTDWSCYCCHVTTSLCYIKRRVIDALGGFEENWPGYQFEDVDFSMRAIKAGFNILYLPFVATHHGSLSKQGLPGFREGMDFNHALLKERHFKDPEFVRRISAYPHLLRQDQGVVALS